VDDQPEAARYRTRETALSASTQTGYSRIALGVAAVVAVVVLWWFLSVRDWTTALAERIRGAGLQGVLIFVAVYVAAEVALVPGSLLTMAAGFAYGPIGGLLVASPASVLAATTAFLLGRTILRGWIQRKIARWPSEVVRRNGESAELGQYPG
jgi:uncharacterized membrane protein YdjX (TVP38/TMEM64 family)